MDSKETDILSKETDILSKETDILSKEAYVYSRSARPYGVATISRLLKIIGLFGKRVLEKRRYSAKETYMCTHE